MPASVPSPNPAPHYSIAPRSPPKKPRSLWVIQTMSPPWLAKGIGKLVQTWLELLFSRYHYTLHLQVHSKSAKCSNNNSVCALSIKLPGPHIYRSAPNQSCLYLLIYSKPSEGNGHSSNHHQTIKSQSFNRHNIQWDHAVHCYRDRNNPLHTLPGHSNCSPAITKQILLEIDNQFAI